MEWFENNGNGHPPGKPIVNFGILLSQKRLVKIQVGLAQTVKLPVRPGAKQQIHLARATPTPSPVKSQRNDTFKTPANI